MTVRQSLALLGALAIAGCSPGPAPVASSPRDPSNPSAPAGASPLPPASPPAEAPAGEHAHEHGPARGGPTAPGAGVGEPGPGPASVAYTCPMHPEVTSSSPGQCPKCGMNLTPKK